MINSIATWLRGRKAHERSISLPASVSLFLFGMVALWGFLCAISHSAPDLDGMEELVWAGTFEWGYYKHPPVPSWFMYAFVAVFGKPVWLPFFAALFFSAIALWFIWLLGCEFTTPRRAFMAMLMTSTIVYFSLRGTIYNHNTVQLWSIAASTWLFYRALRYESLGSWVWLGIVGALAMLTKYSAVIQFAIFALFLLRFGHWRDRHTQRGLTFAIVVFLALVSPHVYWLFVHSFAPLGYADRSVSASGTYADVLIGIFYFLADQLARLSPMLMIWLGLYYWRKKRPDPEVFQTGITEIRGTRTYTHDLTDWDRAFLLWMGLGPIVVTVLASMLFATELVASWGTTFFILYGFYALWWVSGDERTNLRRTAILVVAMHVVMAAGYALARGPLAYYSGWAARSTFPGAAISSEVQTVWDKYVANVPLRLVVADTWLGGNIAIHVSPKTEVLVEGNYDKSPWLEADTALQCGALVAYSATARGGSASAAVRALYDRATSRGQISVPWSTSKSPAIVIEWGIIPPQPECATIRDGRTR